MGTQEYVWFLLGMKQGELPLTVFAFGASDQCAELATEHEPRARKVLMTQLPAEEDIEGFRFYALRLNLSGEVETERKRVYAGFRHFLAKCSMTQVEQQDLMREFGESLLAILQENKDQANVADGMPPLSKSLWGKK